MSGFNAVVMEQVRKEAALEGVLQGLGLGQRNTLKRLLKRRFGTLSNSYLQKIEQADDEQIERWLDNFVDAQAIEQVFL